MAINGEEQRLDSLVNLMRTIEDKIDESEGGQVSRTRITDPELAHKVMHACLKADTISEDEELRIVRALIG